ncbi:Hypothetical predicted protein, partial [Pelobates cultripes]
IYEWSYPKNTAQWVRIEASFFTTPIYAIPWLDNRTKPKTRSGTSHPTITHTVKLWSTIRRDEYLAPHPSPLYPLTGNPSFPPGMDHRAFQNFPKQAHTLTLGDVLNDHGVIPFEQLLPIESQTGMTRLRHSQLKHFLNTDPPLSQGYRTHTLYETQCAQHNIRRGHISAFYKQLCRRTEELLPTYTTKWEAELGIQMQAK